MKKLALALVASTIVTSAASAHFSTGYYVGAALGYGATTAKINTTTQLANGNFGTMLGGTRDIGGNHANIGVHAGYGCFMGCLYMGGEIAYTFENAKINDTIPVGPTFANGQMSVKRNGYFGFAVRGGYVMVANTMMYIRLGANWGRWNIGDSLNGQFVRQAGSGSKSRLSFTPGIGLETAVHRHVYVRVEYVYEFAPGVRATNTVFPNAVTTVGSVRNQSGKVGLSYKF